jgi:Protein of unknown function (DUF2997)
MAAQVKITFLKTGELEVEVLGAQGSSCQGLTKPLEALGATTTQFKPEFYTNQSIALSSHVNLGG